MFLLIVCTTERITFRLSRGLPFSLPFWTEACALRPESHVFWECKFHFSRVFAGVIAPLTRKPEDSGYKIGYFRMTLKSRFVRSRVEWGRNCGVSFEFFVLSYLVIPPSATKRNLQWRGEGWGGGTHDILCKKHPLPICFQQKKKKNKRKQSQTKTKNKVQAKILKFIQSLNDNTTAVSYQVFLFAKISVWKVTSLKYPFCQRTFVLPKCIFCRQYVLVLLAKWLINAAIL